MIQFNSVQLLSRVWLFATPWTAAHQAFLSITNSQSLLKLMAIASVMPSNHLILCCPILLLQDWFPFGCTGCISLQSEGLSRVFSNTQFKHIKWVITYAVNLHNKLLDFKDTYGLGYLQQALTQCWIIYQAHHKKLNWDVNSIFKEQGI